MGCLAFVGWDFFSSLTGIRTHVKCEGNSFFVVIGNGNWAE